MNKLLLTIFLSILFALPTYALDYSKFCPTELGTLPIQQNGRVKPLSVHAKEVIRFLTGKKNAEDIPAISAYCLLNLQETGVLSEPLKLNASIEHVKTITLLGLGESHKIPYRELVQKKQEIRLALNREQDKNSSFAKSLSKTLQKINLYQEIVFGQNWLLPAPNGNEIEWQPFYTYFTSEKFQQTQAVSSSPFFDLALQAKTNYLSTAGDHYLIEYHYDRAKLPSWAMLVTLLALMSMVLFYKKLWVGLSLATLTILIQLTHMSLRIMISGRAPITNMYETVMFSGLGGLILALIIGHYRKEKLFIGVGLAYNACTLMMMNFANGMLSESISPLVPVLRDNFWLSTHVTTIILSYGALALSWVLANFVLIKKKIKGIDKQEETYLSDLTYTCLKYGTVLLAAGIILGGVWADYSWGRFWGWDPKETWSLIVLCIYMAILHGRYTAWIPNSRFIACTAAAFTSVMMAWFGVNYILASGLHSYGFSEGGAIFLGSFFLAQFIVLVLTFNGQNASTKQQVEA